MLKLTVQSLQMTVNLLLSWQLLRKTLSPELRLKTQLRELQPLAVLAETTPPAIQYNRNSDSETCALRPKKAVDGLHIAGASETKNGLHSYRNLAIHPKNY